jgi:hypothetical protein
MAAFFIANAEIVAGRLPFLTVWQDSFSARAKLREEVCELMPKSAINLFPAMSLKKRI